MTAQTDRKTILITGSSSGFGLASAKRLAQAGHRVIATMRHAESRPEAEELRHWAEQAQVTVEVCTMDVENEASVQRQADRVASEHGAVDVLVNNAGVMYSGVTEAFSTDELSRQLEVNLLGAFRVTKAFLPGMRERGQGHIIALSSVVGRFANPFFGLYHASKYAIEGLFEGWAYELATVGIDVTIVEPGPCTTQLFPRMVGPSDNSAEAHYPDLPGIRAGMQEVFAAVFENPNTPTDAGVFAEALARLVELPAEQRPLREVVGIDFGIPEYNRQYEAMRDRMLDGFGLRHLVNASAYKAKVGGDS